MKILVAVCFLAVANRAFGSGDGSDEDGPGIRHGAITPQGQPQPQPVIQYPQPMPYPGYPPLPNPNPRPPSRSVIDTYIQYMVYKELLKLIRPTTTTVATAAPTTVDPCTQWKKVGTCSYYVFYGRWTWNQAKDACAARCSSELAHEASAIKATDATTKTTFADIVGMFPGVPAGANVWIGASDADSAHTVATAKWLDGTDLTNQPAATDYDTSPAIAGCAYYAPGSAVATGIRFNVCTSTSVNTPSYYLCEFC